jgi:hypothetical protein
MNVKYSLELPTSLPAKKYPEIARNIGTEKFSRLRHITVK